MNQEEKVYLKLKKFLEIDAEKIRDSSMLGADGKYLLFGIYEMHVNKDHTMVLKHATEHRFSDKKTAFSWCIADKNNQWNLASDILLLDRARSDIYDDLVVRSAIHRKISDPDRYEAVELKIKERKRRFNEVSQRLTKCINLAKYWQLKGFNNETSRPERTTPNRARHQGI